MGRRKNQQRSRQGGRSRTVWHDITKENSMFEKYYKAQNIVPEAEWDEFMAVFRKDLPSTFRITGTRSQSKQLLHFLKKFYLDNLSEVVIEDEKVEPPKSLTWYPDELAWQVNLSRKSIRKSSSLSNFHNFLVQETECGNISRQEAVSMLPPLLMDIKPGQKVLDTCAAPGSKTSQIIEMLHADEANGVPDGLVIANELQNKRCYMLIHQSKRLRSPACLVTNHDASTYPTLFVKGEEGIKVPLKFDRILCDVPCSGDGTLRKNQLIWNKWTPQLGLSLHRIQARILARAVEMLAVGGRVVYSTCSLNPVENEAVVSELLKNSNGAVELVDISNELPNLKRSPGLFTWKLMMKNGEEVTNCDPGTPAYKGCFRPSHFPPSEQEAKNMNLDRCIRVNPHQQDTGGFFIAVFTKRKCAPWEGENRLNDNPRWLPWQIDADGRKNKKEISDESATKTESKQEDATIDDEDNVVLDSTQEDLDDGENDGNDNVVEKDNESTEPGSTQNGDKVAVKSDEGTDKPIAQGKIDETATETKTESQQEDATIDDEDNVVLDSTQEEQEDMDDVQGGNDNDDGNENVVEKDNGSTDSASAQGKRSLDQPDEVKAISLKPPMKKQKLGYKEDPFILLPDDDPHWPAIQEFYGIDPSFPSNQLLVRSSGGKKRNIYIVSKLVKQVLECAEDNFKIINVGVKTFCRCDSEEYGCEFRIMQEGIDSVFSYVTKRKIYVTEADVHVFLKHDKPFTTKFSQSTRDQLTDVPGLGCVLFIYDPKGQYSTPSDSISCELHFCGWKAKTSIRVLTSNMDKTHYMVLCGIPPGKKGKDLTQDSQSPADNDDNCEEMTSIKSLVKDNPEESAAIGFI